MDNFGFIAPKSLPYERGKLGTKFCFVCKNSDYFVCSTMFFIKKFTNGDRMCNFAVVYTKK